MANCACVVRGSEPPRVVDVELGLWDVARGWEIRKAREEEGVRSLVGAIGWLAGDTGDSRDVKDASSEAFCASVARSAWLSFFVSCNWLRSARIDSGVGAVAGSGTVRFCRRICGISVKKRPPLDDREKENHANLVMSQAHPRRQIVRHCEDVP